MTWKLLCEMLAPNADTLCLELNWSHDLVMNGRYEDFSKPFTLSAALP